MDKIVSLCKRRGIILPGSEIYGGLANTWDYGPYGVEIKNNIKNFWWNEFVQKREDMVGLDSAILMNPKVWEASGHVTSFSDPLMDCKSCKERIRGDKLIEENISVEAAAGKSNDEILEIIEKEQLKCPNCGKCDFTKPRAFNLMFKTYQGVVEGESTEVFLRPETAQGIFVNFKNVVQTTRKKIPFGIGQIGKAFRNEITPGNFTYRTREFEQMEIEYFIEEKDATKYFDMWKELSWNWFKDLGMDEKSLRIREHTDKELSHYSSMTVDIEYKFPFGWGELEGIAYRGCYDLSQHIDHSKEDLQYFDQERNIRYIPHVIEPSMGVERTMLCFLLNSYKEEEVKGEKRVVLSLSPKLAPVKAAILPLSKKEPLNLKSFELYKNIQKHYNAEYDETGSIGKRYRRQDEIGTPYCITYDFDTEEDKKVTIRDRDTMDQERIPLENVIEYLKDKLGSNC